MQNKPAEPAPQANPRATGAGKSVLGGDLKITGDITCDGNIEVMGSVEGTITARSLLIGAEGRVNGMVSAENIEVRGVLDGRISCSGLTLRAAATVTADVTYRTIVIESGAHIDGRFKHSKD